MPLPKSVTKYSNKNGVTFISSVDRANYTITELSRAALRDVVNVLRKKLIVKFKKLPGMKRSKRIYHSVRYDKHPDFKIGMKIGLIHNTWYGAIQELGGNNQPKRSILRDTVFESIDEIQKIEAQYLSSIEDELKAQALIDKAEEVGDEDMES